MFVSFRWLCLVAFSDFTARWGGLLSGKSRATIPIDINSNPQQCCSVSGLVKIKYDNNNVAAFLAVVTCYMHRDVNTLSFILKTRIREMNKKTTASFRGLDNQSKDLLTIAVVAAPKIAMSDKTEIWPMNVAIASNTKTPYIYGCCKLHSKMWVEFNFVAARWKEFQRVQ